MKVSRIITLALVAALILGVTGVAFAQEESPTPEPTSSTVEGTVVGVDLEAGTVDILQSDGTIVTVAFTEGDYDNPITALLAEYFGGASLEDYTTALDDLEMNGSTVVGVEETTDADGNTIWEVTLADGTVETLTDEEEAQALLDALEVTTVSLDVTDVDGTLTAENIGDQIEQYHEMGLGYGELVKIYAIAAESQAACQAEADAAAEADAGAAEGGTETATGDTGEPAPGIEEPCGVTVEELADMLLSGMGMGYLFDQYGKPSLLGVGHVRQALNGGEGGEGGSGDGSQGVCNARGHGGNANANGQDIECPDEP